jgi:hypothetical protein
LAEHFAMIFLAVCAGIALGLLLQAMLAWRIRLALAGQALGVGALALGALAIAALTGYWSLRWGPGALLAAAASLAVTRLVATFVAARRA